MHDYEQIEAIIGTLNKTIDAMRSSCLRSDDLDNIQLIIKEVNQTLYGTDKLKLQKKYNWEDKESQFQFANEIEKMLSIWSQSILIRNVDKANSMFSRFYDYFKYVDKDIIFSQILRNFNSLSEGVKIEYLALPHIHPYLQGKIDIVEKDFSLLRNFVDFMAHKVEQYKWLYDKLADHNSKMILNSIIQFWCTFQYENFNFLNVEDIITLPCVEDSLTIDANGAEIETIYAEKRRIILDKPKMLISLWYKLENLFDIPWIIDEFRSDYKFYLKITSQNSIWSCGYALYVE